MYELLLVGLSHVIRCFLCLEGYGGGYNERENVEYIERDESDSEYDEVKRYVYCDQILVTL